MSQPLITDDKIAEYYLFLKSKKSKHTLKSYHNTIEQLKTFAGSAEQINWMTANKYLENIREQKGREGEYEANMSDYLYAYAILGLLDFARDPDFWRVNVPIVLLQDNPSYLYLEDIDKILASEDTFKGILNKNAGVTKAAVHLSFDLALRIGEARSIKLKDFNAKEGTCLVLREKHKARGPRSLQLMRMSPEAIETVQAYLDTRNVKHELEIEQQREARSQAVGKRYYNLSEQLFVTSENKLLHEHISSGFRDVCNFLKIEDRADAKREVSWHILRHTRLTWMIAKDGASIEETAKFAGHKSTASTMKYYNLATSLKQKGLIK